MYNDDEMYSTIPERMNVGSGLISSDMRSGMGTRNYFMS